jgi:hypothetical protein
MSVLLMIPLVQWPRQMLLILDFTYVVGISTILLLCTRIFSYGIRFDYCL